MFLLIFVACENIQPSKNALDTESHEKIELGSYIELIERAQNDISTLRTNLRNKQIITDFFVLAMYADTVILGDYQYHEFHTNSQETQIPISVRGVYSYCLITEGNSKDFSEFLMSNTKNLTPPITSKDFRFKGDQIKIKAIIDSDGDTIDLTEENVLFPIWATNLKIDSWAIKSEILAFGLKNCEVVND